MSRSSLVISRLSLLFTVAMVSVPRAAQCQVAQEPAAQATLPTGADDNDELILRTYYVGDLLLDIPDYPYPGRSGVAGARALGTGGGGFGGGGLPGGGSGGGIFSVADEGNRVSDPADISMDNLIDAITSTVDSESWAENGGGEADLRPVGKSIVVLQSQDAHDQIVDLLGQLRQFLVERKNITIDARWLLLNSDEVDRLAPSRTGGLPAVDRKLLTEFTRRPTTIRGLTSCFSGQLVYVISGTQRNFVSGYIPVVGGLERPQNELRFAALRGGARFSFVSDETPAQGGDEPRVGYQPIVERSSIGALLEIRPTVLHGEKTAIADLRSTLTVPAGQSDGLAEQAGPVPAPPLVDRIATDTQEFATTLRAPLGVPVLIGGMTYVPPTGALPKAESDQPKLQRLDNPQFYLILELR